MTHIDGTAARKILCEQGWLSQQSETFRQDVLRGAELQYFAQGETIYRCGDPAGGIYGLVSGIFSANTGASIAQSRLVHVSTPGSWTGEAGFFTGQPRLIGWCTLVDSWVMHLPLDYMKQMAARDPDAVRCFAQIMLNSVGVLLRVVHDLQKPEASRRIASVLRRITKTGKQPIPLSQEELGTMANASRKQVNAVLQQFAAAGWVLNTYRAITILDDGALRRFSEEDAPVERVLSPGRNVESL